MMDVYVDESLNYSVIKIREEKGSLTYSIAKLICKDNSRRNEVVLLLMKAILPAARMINPMLNQMVSPDEITPLIISCFENRNSGRRDIDILIVFDDDKDEAALLGYYEAYLEKEEKNMKIKEPPAGRANTDNPGLKTDETSASDNESIDAAGNDDNPKCDYFNEIIRIKSLDNVISLARHMRNTGIKANSKVYKIDGLYAIIFDTNSLEEEEYDIVSHLFSEYSVEYYTDILNLDTARTIEHGNEIAPIYKLAEL